MIYKIKIVKNGFHVSNYEIIQCNSFIYIFFNRLQITYMYIYFFPWLGKMFETIFVFRMWELKIFNFFWLNFTKYNKLIHCYFTHCMWWCWPEIVTTFVFNLVKLAKVHLNPCMYITNLCLYIHHFVMVGPLYKISIKYLFYVHLVQKLFHQCSF